jgi:hypothetical protein
VKEKRKFDKSERSYARRHEKDWRHYAREMVQGGEGYGTAKLRPAIAEDDGIVRRRGQGVVTSRSVLGVAVLLTSLAVLVAYQVRHSCIW